jgi:hypothetical protein
MIAYQGFNWDLPTVLAGIGAVTVVFIAIWSFAWFVSWLIDPVQCECCHKGTTKHKARIVTRLRGEKGRWLLCEECADCFSAEQEP